ncbi:MAG: VanW family protein [Deltaproteobacteria bacterium]|nr:VanW family protein [Deltaproteobacteria bacterium]MCW5807493.1 VanW family protein [Deltaproteobacteria bacterium]
MSSAGGTRARKKQRGAVLLGLAGGMLVVSAGFVGGYYVLGTRSVANAATNAPAATQMRTGAPQGTAEILATEVDLVTPHGAYKVTWADLGAEVDDEEGKRVSGDAASLGPKASIPIHINRDKAIAALLELKTRVDRAPRSAWLDLEAKVIHADIPGSGLDVWGTLPRLTTAARSGATKVELATIALPAAVTKASLGIDDISQVLGTYTTRFPVTDRDRNFNLKLAASKINGVVLRPGVEFSFNGTVGERSEKEGYKIAHVITEGEMVDGLAGGTCQISTTLFGAAFFAGLDIVKTQNHSRPSVYTPLGFDATVVWPRVDLKLANPYEFPVVLRYVVANGEAIVEVLGKKRPYDKIEFVRQITERTDFKQEERLDDTIADGETSIDQAGFPGIKLVRLRRFYQDGKVVRTNRWDVVYPPVTEYIRKGTNTDPDAKKPTQKDLHGPTPPSGDGMTISQ